ncbi:MAG TPA: hypothetical protein VFT00_07330 [Nocardioides sp.]|nr:hypothetical protein [Nocardioides sp.]
MTAVANLLCALMDRVRAGVSLPELLCEEAVDALGVAGASIALVGEDGTLVPLAAAGSCDADLETTRHDLDAVPDAAPGEEPGQVRVGVLTLHSGRPGPDEGVSAALKEFVESASVILLHLRQTGSGALTGDPSPATSITHLADAVRRQQGGSSTSAEQRRHFPWQ